MTAGSLGSLGTRKTEAILLTGITCFFSKAVSLHIYHFYLKNHFFLNFFSKTVLHLQMVGCYKQISCTNTALTWRLFTLCVLLPSIDLLQKSVSQNFIFYTMKRTLKALFSTSQVWDSTKTVLHNYFFQMSYSSLFYMPISSSFVRIPAKRGKQDTKSKQAAGTHWWQPPLAKGSTVQRARGTAKVKGGRKGNAPSQSWTQPPGLISPGLKWY